MYNGKNRRTSNGVRGGLGYFLLGFAVTAILGLSITMVILQSKNLSFSNLSKAKPGGGDPCDPVPCDPIPCDPVPCSPKPLTCVFSHGFWKNHPESWPQDWIILGTVTYTKSQVLMLLWQNKMISQMIAVKFNILNGADPTDVGETIADADVLIGMTNLTTSEFPGTKEEESFFNDFFTAYNEGEIGPRRCEVITPSCPTNVTCTNLPEEECKLPPQAGEICIQAVGDGTDVTYTIRWVNNGQPSLDFDWLFDLSFNQPEESGVVNRISPGTRSFESPALPGTWNPDLPSKFIVRITGNNSCGFGPPSERTYFSSERLFDTCQMRMPPQEAICPPVTCEVPSEINATCTNLPEEECKLPPQTGEICIQAVHDDLGVIYTIRWVNNGQPSLDFDWQFDLFFNQPEESGAVNRILSGTRSSEDVTLPGTWNPDLPSTFTVRIRGNNSCGRGPTSERIYFSSERLFDTCQMRMPPQEAICPPATNVTCEVPSEINATCTNLPEEECKLPPQAGEICIQALKNGLEVRYSIRWVNNGVPSLDFDWQFYLFFNQSEESGVFNQIVSGISSWGVPELPVAWNPDLPSKFTVQIRGNNSCGFGPFSERIYFSSERLFDTCQMRAPPQESDCPTNVTCTNCPTDIASTTTSTITTSSTEQPIGACCVDIPDGPSVCECAGEVTEIICRDKTGFCEFFLGQNCSQTSCPEVSTVTTTTESLGACCTTFADPSCGCVADVSRFTCESLGICSFHSGIGCTPDLCKETSSITTTTTTSAVCTPKTCVDFNHTCGLHNDECEDILNCGVCLTDQICSGNEFFQFSCIPIPSTTTITTTTEPRGACCHTFINTSCQCFPDWSRNECIIFATGDYCSFHSGIGCTPDPCKETSSSITTTTTCVPETCLSLGHTCGTYADGCGFHVNCTKCFGTLTCINQSGSFNCDVAPPTTTTCVPETCMTLGHSCGIHSDECGLQVECGECIEEGFTCINQGGSGFNCVGPTSTFITTSTTCVPETCMTLGHSCGIHSDECGLQVECGECMEEGFTCINQGGSGFNCVGPTSTVTTTITTTTTTVCIQAACQPSDCGIISDGCVGTIDCGPCFGDSCLSKTTGPPTITVPSSTSGSTIGYTQNESTCGSVVIDGPDRFYFIRGNGNMFQASTCSSANFDTKIAVYLVGTLVSDCGSCIVAEDNDADEGTPSCPAAGGARVEWTAQNDVLYAIGVSGAAGATGNFVLTVVAGESCDDPFIPEQSALFSIFSHDTTNYLYDGIVNVGTCPPFILPDSDLGTIGTSPDAFYSFIGTGGMWEVTSCNSSFDIQLSVSVQFDGACSLSSCVQGSDTHPQVSCNSNSAALQFPTAAGSNYLIGVHGQSGASGAYDLQFIGFAPLVGSSESSGSLAVVEDGAYAYEVTTPSVKRVDGTIARSIVALVKKITEPAKAQMFLYADGLNLLGQTDVFNLTVGYNAHNLTSAVSLAPGQTYWIGYAVEFWDMPGTVEFAAYFVGKSNKIAPGMYVAKLPSSLPVTSAIGKSATIYALDSTA